MGFPGMDQKSFLASPASGSESGGSGSGDPSASNWAFPYRGGCSQFLISSNDPFATGKIKFFIFFGKSHLFCIESGGVDFRCVHVSSSSTSATIMSPFQIHPRTERIQGIFQVRFSFQTDGFLTGPSQ